MEAATHPASQRATMVVERRWLVGVSLAALAAILALSVALVIAVSSGSEGNRGGPAGLPAPMSGPAVPGREESQGSSAPLTPDSLEN